MVDGDVNNSTFTNHFKEKYPDRFFNAGIAESNMVGIAAGLAGCRQDPRLQRRSRSSSWRTRSTRSACRSRSRTRT